MLKTATEVMKALGHLSCEGTGKAGTDHAGEGSIPVGRVQRNGSRLFEGCPVMDQRHEMKHGGFYLSILHVVKREGDAHLCWRERLAGAEGHRELSVTSDLTSQHC